LNVHQAKRSKGAAAKREIERMRKAQEALMKSYLRSPKMAAEKKQALKLRERERTERYRRDKAVGKGKKRQL
jgi:hypothetical protein